MHTLKQCHQLSPTPSDLSAARSAFRFDFIHMSVASFSTLLLITYHGTLRARAHNYTNIVQVSGYSPRLSCISRLNELLNMLVTLHHTSLHPVKRCSVRLETSRLGESLVRPQTRPVPPNLDELFGISCYCPCIGHVVHAFIQLTILVIQ